MEALRDLINSLSQDFYKENHKEIHDALDEQHALTEESTAWQKSARELREQCSTLATENSRLRNIIQGIRDGAMEVTKLGEF